MREVSGTRGGAILTVLVLALAAPAATALNEWGHSVDAVLFSRIGTGVGPSAGANPGSVGLSVDAAGTKADTNLILPGTNEVSVRAFVTDITGARVSGVHVTGSLNVGGRVTALSFVETMTPEGDLVYDSQRIGYASGDAEGILAFDFPNENGRTDGTVDDSFVLAYHDV